jgi:DNA polymerase elongation subunit (family B)
MSSARILTIDIETAPNLGYVWGLWDQNIGLSQLVESTEMLCFAAKWLDSKKIEFYSLEKDGKTEMVKAAHRLLSEADVVIGYNQRRFDIPHLNREFLALGLPAPSPFHQIDLLQTVRNKFKFPSNKLDYVAQVTGVGQKVKHQGFELWLGCLAHDPKCWADMEKYCRHDVKITDKAYTYLRDRGWITNGPNLAAYTEDGIGCPTCASTRLQSRGSRPNKSGIWYQRFQCQDCFTWSRGAKTEKEAAKTSLRSIA